MENNYPEEFLTMQPRHANRLAKLEQMSPSGRPPTIRLVTDGKQTLGEAFEQSGHPGKMEDYFVINRAIIEPQEAA